MSTETRLARLGLLHLKHKPEELKRRLEEMLSEIAEELQQLRERLASEQSRDDVNG